MEGFRPAHSRLRAAAILAVLMVFLPSQRLPKGRTASSRLAGHVRGALLVPGISQIALVTRTVLT
jgi:hypothetical protein